MEDQFSKKLSSLSEISKNQLLKIFNFYSGSKDLIIEPELIKPLERICGAIWLKGNGIDKIYKLETSPPKKSDSAQFYMIYSNPITFGQVIGLIRNQLGLEDRPKNKFHIVCVPQVLYSFETQLEEEGLFGLVELYSLQWQPIQLDKGVLSLELPNMFKNLFVQQDLSLIQSYAKSLWYLYFVTGKPRLSIAVGQNSINILKQLDSLHEDLAESDRLESDFGSLVILDRTIDYPSVLLTPRTYTALLKEIYNVKCGVCEKKNEPTERRYDNKFNVVTGKNPVQLNLDSRQDSVYNNVKNRHFTEVISILGALTKQLKSEKDTSKEMALDELKLYVKKQLKESTSKKNLVANHLSAAESIINVLGNRFEKQQEIEQYIMSNKNKSGNYAYLEESLLENDKLYSLRLLLLLCVTQKLSDGDVAKFLSKYHQEFGYGDGFLYNNLIKLGFVEPDASSFNKIKLQSFFANSFYQSAASMKLIPPQPERIDVKNPTCASYVFGGCYVPLTAQIMCLLLGGTPLKEIEAKLRQFGAMRVTNEHGFPLTTRTILLYVVGGVTYAEVAACNLLESLTGSRIVVMSDQVVSGNDVAEGLLEPIPY